MMLVSLANYLVIGLGSVRYPLALDHGTSDNKDERGKVLLAESIPK